MSGDIDDFLNARGLRDAAMQHEVSEQAELPWPFAAPAYVDPKVEAEAAQRELATKLLASAEPLAAWPLAEVPGMWGIWLGEELIGGPYARVQAKRGVNELDAWRKAVAMRAPPPVVVALGAVGYSALPEPRPSDGWKKPLFAGYEPVAPAPVEPEWKPAERQTDDAERSG